MAKNDEERQGNSAFFGHSSIFEYIEPLRHMGFQDSRSGTNGFYASAATRISFELGEMSRDALAGVFPDIGELRENILGTGTVAMMHPDFRPTSSFWLTEELFEEKIRGIFSPSFPGARRVSGASFRKERADGWSLPERACDASSDKQTTDAGRVLSVA